MEMMPLRFAKHYCEHCYHAGDEPCLVHGRREMGEKRYYIVEVDEGFHKWDRAITESELRKRITVFADEAYLENEGLEAIIQVLLHGEKEG